MCTQFLLILGKAYCAFDTIIVSLYLDQNKRFSGEMLILLMRRCIDWTVLCSLPVLVQPVSLA